MLLRAGHSVFAEDALHLELIHELYLPNILLRKRKLLLFAYDL